jgi:hypothetical protein
MRGFTRVTRVTNMSQRYKGRLTDPHPYELADGSGWSAEVYIAEDTGNETIDTQYFIQGIFPTREAAVQAAVTSGRRVVDKLISSREVQSVIASGTQLPPSIGLLLPVVDEDGEVLISRATFDDRFLLTEEFDLHAPGLN